jgi:ABC-2 type transport system permease protein
VTGPGWLLLLAINLGSSALVLLAFQFTWGSLAFWAPRAAEEISSSTMQLMTQLVKYPLDGLGAALTGGLLTMLPVGFLAWVPCRALLGQARGWEWATPAAALAFALVAALVWREGMRHYGRVGSQRYSGRGFRG